MGLIRKAYIAIIMKEDGMQEVTATPECQQKRLTDARVESARSSPCCEANESFRSPFTSSDSADTCALPTETAEQHVARRAREARINGMRFDTFVCWMLGALWMDCHHVIILCVPPSNLP